MNIEKMTKIVEGSYKIGEIDNLIRNYQRFDYVSKVYALLEKNENTDTFWTRIYLGYKKVGNL